mgnify:CR=1 FL=1
MNIKLKKCRVCESTKLIPTGVEKNFFLANLNMTVTHSYVSCASCRCIFQESYLGDDFLENYYSQSPMLRRKNPTKYEIDQNKRQAAFLNGSISPEVIHKVMEIGAHTGGFLEHLNDVFGWQTYFNELSAEAVEIMRKNPKLHEDTDNGTKYDLVIMRHVLEHIHDISTAIDNLLLKINAGCYLYVEVPDWSFFDYQTDPLIFEHLSQFNASALIEFFEKKSMVLVDFEKSIHPEDPATPNRVVRLLFRQNSQLDYPVHITFGTHYEQYQNQWYRKVDALLRENPEASFAIYPSSHLSYDTVLNTNLSRDNCLGYFDIDQKKVGEEYLSLLTHNAECIGEAELDYIFLCTMAYEPEIRDFIKEKGSKAHIVSIMSTIGNRNS